MESPYRTQTLKGPSSTLVEQPKFGRKEERDMKGKRMWEQMDIHEDVLEQN